jgi:hypothetical protein
MTTSDLHPYDIPWPLVTVGLGVFGCIALALALLFAFGSPIPAPPAVEVGAATQPAETANSKAWQQFELGPWVGALVVAMLLVGLVFVSNYSPNSAKVELRQDLRSTYGVTLTPSSVNEFVSKVNGSNGFDDSTQDALGSTDAGDKVKVTLLNFKNRVRLLDASTGIELPKTGATR